MSAPGGCLILGGPALGGSDPGGVSALGGVCSRGCMLRGWYPNMH